MSKYRNKLHITVIQPDTLCFSNYNFQMWHPKRRNSSSCTSAC